MPSSELSGVTWRLDDHERELRHLREDLTAERRARHAAADQDFHRGLTALRKDIQGWSREPKPSRAKATRHEPVASSVRNRRGERSMRRFLRGGIRGMEMREVLHRNTEAFERFRESMERHAEAAKEQTMVAKELAEAAREHAKAAKKQARVFDNQCDVMRAMVVDLKAHGEQLKYDRDALTGAFADLATEIRGWKNGR